MPTYPAPTRRPPPPGFVSAGLAALCLLACDLAAGAARAAPAQAPARAFLVEGRATLPPMAYLRFCKTYPGECAAPIGDAPAPGPGEPREERQDERLAERLSELRRVNRQANTRIRPVVRLPGAPWLLEAASGDCNTYAVQKRHALLKAGWPPAALSLAVVITSMGEGHLVLVARTGAGDLVLDNLHNDVRPWNATGYAWRKIQSARDASNWVDVAADRSVAALAPTQRARVAGGT